MMTAIATTTMPSSLPVRSSSRCNGVVSSGVALSSPAMRPISVCMPVAVTTALPCPYVAAVPLKTMLSRSPRGTSSRIGAIPFVTGRLSPVSAASAVCSAADSIRRPSAGMVSPSSMRMMSPGTTCEAGTLRRVPPRITVASAADIARSAATAASARDAWMWPIVAFNSTTARMAIASYGRAASTLDDPEGGGDPGRDEEQDDEDVLELRQEPPPGGDSLVRGQLVRSVPGEPSARFLVAQPPSLIGPERGDQLAGVLPVRTTGLWCFAGEGRHIGPLTSPSVSSSWRARRDCAAGAPVCSEPQWRTCLRTQRTP